MSVLNVYLNLEISISILDVKLIAGVCKYEWEANSIRGKLNTVHLVHYIHRYFFTHFLCLHN